MFAPRFARRGGARGRCATPRDLSICGTKEPDVSVRLFVLEIFCFGSVGELGRLAALGGDR